MYSKCEHCGEFAVDDSENIEVCKSCGIVVDESTFSSAERVPVGRSTFKPFKQSEAKFYKQKKKPITLKHGQTVIDNLFHMNNIPSMWKNELNELFSMVLSTRRFSKKEDAGTAAACCLFLLMRNNKQAIAINRLCEQVPCTKRKFSFFLKFIKSCLSSNDKFKQFSFLLDNPASERQENEEEVVTSDLVPSLIHEICEKAETEEKTQLMEKTASLIKLAYSCWLFTGRSPRSVVAASAFVCWKSMQPSRKKIPFSKFSSEFEIHEPKANLRVLELKSLLLKLGKMIPSRTENYVNKDNVLFHLNTILENSETLRNDLFPDSYTSDEVNAVEFTNFRYLPKGSHPRKEPSDAVHYDSDMNASDIEISDSEIETYLISDKKKIIEFCEKKKLES